MGNTARMATAARVVVLGAGVAGASTAFALARAGASVTVVDSPLPGQATAAGAGINEPWTSTGTGPGYDLYAAGAGHYPRLLDELRAVGITDIGYRRTGALVVDSDSTRLDDVEQRVRRRIKGVALAGSIERLNPGETVALFPPLACDLYGLYISGGARVDGRRLRDGLLAAAQHFGAVLIHDTARLQAPTTGGCAVGTATRAIDADAVVVACGAWTNDVLEPLGRRIDVEPQRGQLVHLVLDGTDTSGWPSVLPPTDHYLVAFDGGRVVVGATRETGAGFDPRVTAAGLREVLENALTIAPGLASATVAETRVGLRPLAGGGIPVVGPVPDVAGLFVNAGFGAAGLTMAPAAGAALAQLILTGSSDLDLAGFAPR